MSSIKNLKKEINNSIGELIENIYAFEILNPEARYLVKKRLDEIKENNISNFNMISEEFQKILKAEGLNVKIFGREKTPFSIWRKIQKKRTSLEQITDIIGFRVMSTMCQIVINLWVCFIKSGTVYQEDLKIIFHLLK